MLDPLLMEVVDDEYDEMVESLLISTAALECSRVSLFDDISAVVSLLTLIEPALLMSTFAFF